MAEFKEYSAVEIIQLLGAQFREYRLRLNMTQKDVSERAEISILTINKFENGTIGKMSFATFIALIRAIGYIDNLEHLLPILPESPYLYKGTKKVQRVRHKRKLPVRGQRTNRNARTRKGKGKVVANKKK